MSLSFFPDLIIAAPIIAVIFIIALSIYRVCFHHSNNVTLEFPCWERGKEKYITGCIEEAAGDKEFWFLDPDIIWCWGGHNNRTAPLLPCKCPFPLSGLSPTSPLWSLQMNWVQLGPNFWSSSGSHCWHWACLTFLGPFKLGKHTQIHSSY